MAEYSGRYDVGSLESTDRKSSDWTLIKRIIREYMTRHKSLMLIIGRVLPVRTILVLAGPYIYKVAIDHFIGATPGPSSQWLADIIKSIGTALGGRQFSRELGVSSIGWASVHFCGGGAVGSHVIPELLYEQARPQHNRGHPCRLF